jgi:hypothetical protein
VRKLIWRIVFVLGPLVLLALGACTAPTVPTARWCGVDTLRIPVVVDTVRYEELVIRPRPCPTR